MKNSVTNNKRIAQNTIILYIRMIVKMVVTLYTSRIILGYLGITDYGIYNVVGGIVVLLGFINTSMAASVQRFLSFELGKKNIEGVGSIFSMAIFIHVIIAIIVFVFAEIIGFFILPNLNIPIERHQAAQWLFQLSVLTSCITIVQAPYAALIITYEKMGTYAYISILEVLLRLLIVFLLPVFYMDKLVCYGFLLLTATILISIIYGGFCSISIKEVRFQFIWDKIRFKKMFLFASWCAVGGVSWAMTGQGVNIILNLFFPPSVNAARAIAVQVMVALNVLAANVQTAINPQIIKLYAAENKKDMIELSLRGIRLSLFLMLSLAIPVLLNIDFILNIWLSTIPEMTATFCILAVISSLFDVFSNILDTVIKATGEIKKYQIIQSVLLMLNLPLSYLLLQLGNPAFVVYIVYMIISVLLIFIRIYLLRKYTSITFFEYADCVIKPIMKVVIVSLPFCLFVKLICGINYVTVLVSGIICILSFCISVYLLGLNADEKAFVREKLSSIKMFK